MNLIFDLDDTLYLEKQHIYQGFLAVARELGQHFGLKPVTLFRDMKGFLAQGSTRVFDDLKEKYRFQLDVKTLLPVYRDSPRRLKLFPDVIPVLKRLRTEGYGLILLTNGKSATQWKKIDDLGVKEYFDLILVTDDYGRDCWKPSPGLMIEIRRKIGGCLSDYLMIGNAEDDREFARQARINFLYVQRPGRIKEIKGYPGEVFTDLFQMADRLASMQEI